MWRAEFWVIERKHTIYFSGQQCHAAEVFKHDYSIPAPHRCPHAFGKTSTSAYFLYTIYIYVVLGRCVVPKTTATWNSKILRRTAAVGTGTVETRAERSSVHVRVWEVHGGAHRTLC